MCRFAKASRRLWRPSWLKGEAEMTGDNFKRSTELKVKK
jgi:hypothetical protein